MSSSSINQVIMFADVVGSTSLYETLGDSVARGLVNDCLGLARESTNGHSGKIIAEIGDEVMAVFEDPGDAAAAACEIHANMLEIPTPESSDLILRMRIGMHYGPVAGLDDELTSETSKIAHWRPGMRSRSKPLAPRL